MSLPARVTMREVGTRDGIQSLGAFVPTEHKIEMANRLATTGLTRIEVTSFVSPKAVPQMADAEQVMAGIERVPGVSWEALVPNVRGTERALATNPDQILVVLSASDAFNLKNIRMTIDDSLKSIGRDHPPGAGPPACRSSPRSRPAFGCPYSGEVPEERLFGVIKSLLDLGRRRDLHRRHDRDGEPAPGRADRLARPRPLAGRRVRPPFPQHARDGAGERRGRAAGRRHRLRRLDRRHRRLPVRPEGDRQRLDRGRRAHAPRDGH